MYDKVKLWIARSRETPDVTHYLENAKEQIDHTTGEVCTYGGCGGLRVCSFSGGVSIIGSLAKFHFGGGNVMPMDITSTEQALSKLSDSLHIKVGGAKVTGLEFGRAFLMSHPPRDYINRMGEVPRMTRVLLTPESLAYRSKGKQRLKEYVLYDKRADATVKGMPMPCELEDANLLRYEVRLNGRLPQQIGCADVRADTLTEPKFYNRIIDIYRKTYNSIKKVNKVKNNALSTIKTVGDAYDVFVATLISKIEPTEIGSFIQSLKDEDVFDDPKYYTRLKDKLERVSSKATVTEDCGLIEELNERISNVEYA